jgi:glycosyltransferase involved in cell wall biosynthesis
VHSIGPVAAVEARGEQKRQIFMPGPVQRDAGSEVLAAASAMTDADVIIGTCEPAAEQQLRRRADELGMGARVRFAGTIGQEELTRLYDSSLIVVHWRYTEPRAHAVNHAACSYPVIDAMSRGSVCVTNSARGALEYVVDSAAAFDLSTHPDDLAMVLAELWASAPSTVEIGHRAFRYAEMTFSPSVVATEVADLIEAASRP